MTSAPGSRPDCGPRRRRKLAERLAARLAAVLVMPEALARLERLVAARTGVRTRVRVRPLVRPHCRRVLEPLSADATLLTQLVRVFEQHVLLQMVSLLEPATTTQATFRSPSDRSVTFKSPSGHLQMSFSKQSSKQFGRSLSGAYFVPTRLFVYWVMASEIWIRPTWYI